MILILDICKSENNSHRSDIHLRVLFLSPDILELHAVRDNHAAGKKGANKIVYA